MILVAVLPVAAVAQVPEPAVVTLEEAVELALENDPAAVAAQSAVAMAEAGVLEARGAWLPSLTVNSGYSNSSNERFDQATGRLVSESYTARAIASYDIFAGGRRFLDQRAASSELDAADADLRAQRFRTILATTELFYGAAAADELVRLAGQRLERARQQLEFAQTRLEVGTATRSDLLRAQLEMGNAELAVVDAESARRGARLRLGRQLGLEHGAVPAAATLPEHGPALPALDELIRRAERSAPQVTAARAAVESRRAARWAARSAYLPSVGVSGGYDWFAFQFPPDQRSWSLRLTVSLPVFDGFRREAAGTRAAAAERTAEARARDAALAVRVAVEDAAREIRSAERRIDIARRAVELAREDLRVQEERYRIGNATIVELQTSQVALSDAEVAHVRARQALGVAVARLEATLGQRLDGES